MKRRTLLHMAISSLWGMKTMSAGGQPAAARAISRIRPGELAWPSSADWDRLRGQVKGQLIEVRSPLVECIGSSDSSHCAEVFARLRNPYYIGDEAGLTQTLGWTDAWTPQPSVYAVAAETAQDVMAAIDFAREHNLRLVIKGGGHSIKAHPMLPIPC